MRHCIGVVALLVASAAHAQGSGGPNAPSQPAAPEANSGPVGGQSDQTESFGGPIWQRGNLLGGFGGRRTSLADHGLTFGLTESADVIGNATGGTRTGAVFEGLLSMSMGLDTGKAGLWAGGTFNASALQIHGRGLSLNNLDNNGNTVSSLEALRGTLLFELWYEQALFNGKLSVRVGQLAAGEEFQITQYGQLFVNHTFGWNTLNSADLPAGGPDYPLATPGVRVRYAPSDATTLLLGLFNGNSAGPGQSLPQFRDPSGTAFRLNDGVFAIAEVQQIVGGGDGQLLGAYKFGAWYNSNAFNDQRTASNGVTLADPSNQNVSLGRVRRGNFSLYAVADQLVYRKAGTKDQGVGVFVRLQGTPGDRNLVNFYVDVGATWKGLIAGRGDDTLGLGYSLSRTSDTASRLDRDIRDGGNPAYPIRRAESVLELTYQAQIAPWWQVQPTAQYLFNLNGGVPNPRAPGKRLGDAAVFGLRTNVTF